MKKIVLTFGLIAGVILSAMLLIATRFREAIGFDRGMVIGYTSMVIAFLLIFFGVKSFRDNVAGGSVTFGRAFAVGMQIAVVASVCYVITWEVIYYKLAPDYAAKYQAYVLEKARADGATEAELATQKAEMDEYMKLYRNPVINAGITFFEPLPVALVIALVSAGVLSRRREEGLLSNPAVEARRSG
jgi:hypothetical protein